MEERTLSEEFLEMEDLLKEMAEDAAEPVMPTDGELSTISRLAEQQRAILGPVVKPPTGDAISSLVAWGKKNKLDELVVAEELRELNIVTLVAALMKRLKEFRHICETALPEAMAEAGVESLTLLDGASLGIKKDISCGIREGMIDEAVEWLDDHRLGDIVKDEIKFELAKDEREHAEHLLRLARVWLGIQGTEKLSVNAMTLKATINQQREAGVELPTNIFSVYDLKRAEIIPPKTKKGKK